MITAEVSQSDLERLAQLFRQVESTVHRETPALIRQSIIFALQSATKATKPGTRSKLSTLEKKYRFRPLVPLSGNFYHDPATGNVFDAGRQLSRGEVAKRGLKKVTKGIKIWDRKANRFIVRPYAGTKVDTSDPLFKIPNAGAAKAGWLMAYRRLSGKAADLGGIRANLAAVKISSVMAEVVNKVRYVSTISPDSAAAGVAAARARMEKIYIPKIAAKLEKDFNK